MWIFLNDAFLSIVADRNDPDSLLVRGRFPADIERIFPEAEVLETPNADYRFRTFLHRDQVSRIIGEKVLALSATNFKASVKENWRHSVYLDVWQCMANAQHRLDARERSGAECLQRTPTREDDPVP